MDYYGVSDSSDEELECHLRVRWSGAAAPPESSEVASAAAVLPAEPVRLYAISDVHADYPVCPALHRIVCTQQQPLTISWAPGELAVGP